MEMVLCYAMDLISGISSTVVFIRCPILHRECHEGGGGTALAGHATRQLPPPLTCIWTD